MSDRYILVGQTPVPCRDLLASVAWMAEHYEDCIVARTNVLGLCWVSTIFLGQDLSLPWPCGSKPEPILFETVAIWNGGGLHEQERCATWLEAERQHVAMVCSVSRPAAVWASCGRAFRDWWCDAAWDWRMIWHEQTGKVDQLTTLDFALQAMRKLRDRDRGR